MIIFTNNASRNKVENRYTYYGCLILRGGGLFGFSRKSDTFFKRGGLGRFPASDPRGSELFRSEVSDPRGSEGVGAEVSAHSLFEKRRSRKVENLRPPGVGRGRCGGSAAVQPIPYLKIDDLET